jgi:amino acid transporter
VSGPRRASLFQLIFLMYSVICGGAYGLEEMVSTTGPGFTFALLLALPILWAAPVSLACAELSAAYPVEGGYYRWARMAFGDFVGYLAGWFVWLSTFATNAAFAVLFANYTAEWIPGEGPGMRFAIAVALVWVTTFLNYRGIQVVGTLSVVFTVFIFIPFFLMSALGLAHARFNPFVPFLNPDKTFATAVSSSLAIGIWLYAGYEKLSTAAAEVDEPARAFPISLAVALPMTVASYVIPTFAALAANGDWRDWGAAHFTPAARMIGGPALGTLMAVGALVANGLLLMTTLLAQSRLPMVLAEDGLFPSAFRKTHPRYGSPVASLVLGGIVLTVLCRYQFTSLTGLYALVQVAAYLLIYAALFRLRGAGSPARDPAAFKIPLGRAGLVLMIAPSVVLATLVVGLGLFHDGGVDGGQVVLDLLVFASGPVSYAFVRLVGRTAREPGARVD